MKEESKNEDRNDVTGTFTDTSTFIKRAHADLASVIRVSHRLVMTPDATLPQVLDKLLPRLLHRVGDNNQARIIAIDVALKCKLDEIHIKLVDILSHIMKRVRADPLQCKLPMLAILQLLMEDASENNIADFPKVKTSVDPFTMNLAFTFLQLGMPYISTFEQQSLLPNLLLWLHKATLHPKRPAAPANLILQCIHNMAMQHDGNQMPARLSGSTPASLNVSTINHDALTRTRRLLNDQQPVAGSFFDLLLDSILNCRHVTTSQTTTSLTSTMPPDGLSQFGYERLTQGWVHLSENAISPSTLKLAVLHCIAPSRCFALFAPPTVLSIDLNKPSALRMQQCGLPSTSIEFHQTRVDQSKESHGPCALGWTRTVALLVAATGDPASDVVRDQAKTYLKLYTDHHGKGSGFKEHIGTLLGDAPLLAISLLSLCLGQLKAEKLLATSASAVSCTSENEGEAFNSLSSFSLGLTPQWESSVCQKTVLASKRRSVSEAHITSITSFVSSTILDEIPSLFEFENSVRRNAFTARAICLLSLEVARQTLNFTAGMTTGWATSRRNPHVAAAQLLQAVATRLSTYNYQAETMPELNFDPRELLAQNYEIVFVILSKLVHFDSISSNTSNLDFSNESNIAVRDACYGTISTLCRSPVVTALAHESSGSASLTTTSDQSASIIVSVQTAKLLFGGVTNEHEKLRPRVVASLDALLVAYMRFYYQSVKNVPPLLVQPCKKVIEDTNADVNSIVNDNPWGIATFKDDNCLNTEKFDDNAAKSLNCVATAKSLLPILWMAAQGHKPKASRVAAAQWTSDLMCILDVDSACHLLCYLAGDMDATVANLARRGLGIENLSMEKAPVNDMLKYPDFERIVALLFSGPSKTSESSFRMLRYWDFSYQGKARTLRFCLCCLLHDFYGGSDTAINLYLSALCQTLRHFCINADESSFSTTDRFSIDLLDECSSCLQTVLSSSQYARTQILAGTAFLSVQELEGLALNVCSSRARSDLAFCCGKLYSQWHSCCVINDTKSFGCWLETSGLYHALFLTNSKLTNLLERTPISAEIHGSVYLGAHAVRVFRLSTAIMNNEDCQTIDIVNRCWDLLSTLVIAFGRGAHHIDAAFGNACSDCIALALSYDTYDAPLLHKRMYSSSSSLLSDIASALQIYGHGDSIDPTRINRLLKAAGVALATTTTASGVTEIQSTGPSIDVGGARICCVEAVFSLLGSAAYRGEEEIAIYVGEALASYADAYHPTNIVWNANEESYPSEYSEEFARGLAPHRHILYILLTKTFASSNPQIRTSTAPALLAIVARAARGVNSDPYFADRLFVKELKKYLSLIQQVFILILSDSKSKQLCRESCCLGLAACRGICGTGNNGIETSLSENLDSTLLRAFGQSTKYDESALIETPIQAAQRRFTELGTNGNNTLESSGAESEVGGVVGMGEAALGAYREMAAASVSLGRHDILYALLILSISHSCWLTPDFSDRYSASSLLGESTPFGKHANARQMQLALRPYLGKLLPRLLRAKHDPNKQTREQISSLWFGLTGTGADARLLITQHFLCCLDTLLEDASSKLWRSRVGACGALTELIVGREWEDFGEGGSVLDDDDMYESSSLTAGIRFLRLWRVAMRALDDVRAAVRESGESLARGLRALTIRLSDPSMGDAASGDKEERENAFKHEQNASAAAATSLRWLVKHGFSQSCSESIGICISTLAQIVGTVKPRILEPVLPDLLRSLLMAMSGLEPAALNYLQLHTSDQDGLERLRLQVAQFGPLATAISRCLELAAIVDVNVQRQIVPQLDSALRLSAGFATRVAVADAVSALCSSIPNAFQFSGPSGTNPSVSLLRAIFFAIERERGQGSKDRLVSALGSIANLCPGCSVRVIALRACDRYVESTGNNEDPTLRKAAAAVLRAIAIRASHHFGDGGNDDIWRTRVLPIAFLGRKDSDPDIANLWLEVWQEGGSSTQSPSVKTAYLGTTLEEIFLTNLVRECIRAIQDVSWSRRVAGIDALKELSYLGVLSPLPQTSSSSSWSCLEHDRAFRRVKESTYVLEQCILLLRKPRLWTGKATFLTSTVQIILKWLNYAYDEEKSVCNCNNLTLKCFCKPIIVDQKISYDDLFEGDNWFKGDSTWSDSNETKVTTVQENHIAKGIEARETENCLQSQVGLASLESSWIHKGERVNLLFSNEYCSRSLSFKGICRLFLNQALQTTQGASVDETLPYRAAAFIGLRDLLGALDNSKHEGKIIFYKTESTRLLSYLKMELGPDRHDAPLLVASGLNCLEAALWFGLGKNDGKFTNKNILDLAEFLCYCGGKQQPAWTVREAAARCIAKLATVCHFDALKQPSIITAMIATSTYALGDKKFWKVRYAGLMVIQALTMRAGCIIDKQSDEKVQILEALLPHKEEMHSLLQVSLNNTEAEIKTLSTQILQDIAWWP